MIPADGTAEDKATTFCGKKFEASDVVKRKTQSKSHVKNVKYNKVIPLCKEFRNAVFENVQEQKICRVVSQQK